METVTGFISLSFKTTANGDCSHEITRHLLFGRKAMTNLDSILKRRDITQRYHFDNKGPYGQSCGFSCSHVWMWEVIKKAECWRIDAFKLWCWRRLLRVLWTARWSNQSILKKLTLKIHWEDWCWSWSSNPLATWCEEPTHWKRPWCWKRLRAGGVGCDKGWDDWMALSINWTWVWANLVK